MYLWEIPELGLPMMVACQDSCLPPPFPDETEAEICIFGSFSYCARRHFGSKERGVVIRARSRQAALVLGKTVAQLQVTRSPRTASSTLQFTWKESFVASPHSR